MCLFVCLVCLSVFVCVAVFCLLLCLGCCVPLFCFAPFSWGGQGVCVFCVGVCSLFLCCFNVVVDVIVACLLSVSVFLVCAVVWFVLCCCGC